MSYKLRIADKERFSNVCMGFFALILIVTLFSAFLLTEEKPKFHFDEEIQGEKFSIQYYTYCRIEPNKRTEKLAELLVVRCVTATGAKAKTFCPFTTCDCGGGHQYWVEVVVTVEDGYVIGWVPAEAIYG